MKKQMTKIAKRAVKEHEDDMHGKGGKAAKSKRSSRRVKGSTSGLAKFLAERPMNKRSSKK